jgi:hypothetical protein
MSCYGSGIGIEIDNVNCVKNAWNAKFGEEFAEGRKTVFKK